MKALRDFLDQMHPKFSKGGKLEKLYPLYEALDTFAYTPGEVAEGKTHVRDGMDLKRLMVTVVIALIPVTLMAMWNTGYQANLVLSSKGIATVEDWRGAAMAAMGLGFDPNNFLSNFVYGALFFLPVYIVTMTAGGIVEGIFSTVNVKEL